MKVCWTFTLSLWLLFLSAVVYTVLHHGTLDGRTQNTFTCAREVHALSLGVAGRTWWPLLKALFLLFLSFFLYLSSGYFLVKFRKLVRKGCTENHVCIPVR